MKICLFLLSEGLGGAENVVFYLAKFFRCKGHDVALVVNDEIHERFTEIPGLEIINIGPVFEYPVFLKKNFNVDLPSFLVKNKKISKGVDIFLKPVFVHLNFLKIKHQVIQSLARLNPEVIHFHNPRIFELYYHIYRELPYQKVYTAHGIDFKKIIHPVDYIIEMNKKKLLNSFNKVTTVSQFTRNSIQKSVAREIVVIENGIDYAYLKQVRESPEDARETKKLFLLFPGGSKENKGGHLLLNVMKILERQNCPVHLYYAGDLPEDGSEIRDFPNVTFTDFLSHGDYIRLLHTCDCLILLSRTEAFPIAILEAMALGKGIITTPAGGIPEYFYDGVNVVFTPRREEDILATIESLVENPEKIDLLSRNNIEDARRFDWTRVTEKYLHLYTTET
jgi:glycosyltransferase involved in cell wall biosynthesis